MKKVIDLTDNVFELLKYEKHLWLEKWHDELFFLNPTIYGKYFTGNSIDIFSQDRYIKGIHRIELDKLHIFWEEEKSAIFEFFFKTAGELYRSGLKNFGIFIIVGFDVKEITIVDTSKGKAAIIDLWFIRRAFDGKKYTEVRKMDEFAALLS